MEKRKKSTAKDCGGNERKIMADHIQQASREISLEGDLQENRQQYHIEKPSGKGQLHLYGDEESAQRISRERVQQIMDSSQEI